MSTHGVVVDHKESHIRYAVSDKNFNEKVHEYVRDLRPGETVVGYQPKPRSKGSLVNQPSDNEEDTLLDDFDTYPEGSSDEGTLVTE